MFKAVKPNFDAVPLDEDTRSLFASKKIPRPSDWAPGNVHLGIAYGEQGAFSFNGREWQKDIVDAYFCRILAGCKPKEDDELLGGYKTVMVCGPVQIGKSIAGIDIPWIWWNKFVGGRSLVVYADLETAKDTFDEKIKNNIKQNLSELWDGNEDHLRREKVLLLNGICRCGSANVENDFATFPSDLVQLDEVSKYQSSKKETNGFDAIGAARGRQKSYKGVAGYHGILSLVSSPKKHRDPFYNEIHKGGVLILRCQMPCPVCGFYHELTDENIKELPNERGEFDHNHARISQDNAAVYECPNCKGIIHDIDRWKMLKKYIWVADGEEVDKDGNIKNESPLRRKADDVCLWFNRLLSMPDKWTFADCLSAFFAARSSMDARAWETYQNEDMARFMSPKSEAPSYSYLLSKCLDYYQYSESARVPDGVEILFCGVDTQDDGFYYVVRGYGKNMETWLIRHDFIKCDMSLDTYKDPKNVLEVVKNNLLTPVYFKNDGTIMDIYAGFIDEGGHRQADVHFLCKHLHFLKSYKGSSSPGANLIARSKTGDHFLGNTQSLSEIVAKFIAGSSWYYPKDIGKTYLEQVVSQYWQEERDLKGNLKYKWVSGRNDHYRDCENYIMAMVMINNLQEKLTTESGLSAIRHAVTRNINRVQPTITAEAKPPQQRHERPNPFKDTGRYREMLRQPRNRF
jgi:phage terminase large subunit GpA-like protein